MTEPERKDGNKRRTHNVRVSVCCVFLCFDIQHVTLFSVCLASTCMMGRDPWCSVHGLHGGRVRLLRGRFEHNSASTALVPAALVPYNLAKVLIL